MKGKTDFEIDKCKGCGLCASVCPVGILQLTIKKTNIKGYHPMGNREPEKCLGCGNCALMCPDGIISVYREERKS